MVKTNIATEGLKSEKRVIGELMSSDRWVVAGVVIEFFKLSF